MRRARQLQAGMRERQQMAAQIAAVHGRDIHWQQWLAALRVVPVHEMPALAPQPSHTGQRALQPQQQILGSDPAKLPGTGDAQEVQANIGR